MDNRFAYNGLCGRSKLKELWALTSIHLCMKFPIEDSITTVRNDQMSVRECYLNSHRNTKSWDVNVVLMDIDMNNPPNNDRPLNKGKTSK